MTLGQDRSRSAARWGRRSVVASVAVAVAAAGTITSVGEPPRSVAAVSPGGTVDRSPAITLASFADPPSSTGVKFRYWVPLAFMDEAEIRREIAEIAEAGAGGVELVAFPVVGINQGNPLLQTHGWGSARWQDRYRVMLEAAEEHGIAVDSTIGPLWNSTTPEVTDMNSPAAAKQLHYSFAEVPNGAAAGAVPTNHAPAVPAGSRLDLVAAVAAKCADASCATATARRPLDLDSVVDITDDARDGTIAWTAPDDGGQWFVITFHQGAAAQTAPRFGSRTLANTTSGGTIYVTDFLGRAGVDASTKYWERHLLNDPEIRELIRDIGRADLFEDSLELKANTMTWTGEFLRTWRAERGYDPVRFLPGLAGANRTASSANTAFEFAGLNQKIRDDYRRTWHDLYVKNRLQPLQRWANLHGMQTRAQSYGEAVDLAAAAQYIDSPEVEQSAQGNNPELYRHAAAGADRQGHNLVSLEAFGDGGPWGLTQAGATGGNVMMIANNAFAGGVSEIVWHGYPYITYPEETSVVDQRTWPGATFGGVNSASEAFGGRMPQWEQYDDAFGYMGRVQLMLRQGQAKHDVAFYNEGLDMDSGAPSRLTKNGPVTDAGYLASPVSPDYLDDEDATVTDGALFADTVDYRGMIVPPIASMHADAAERIAGLAEAGLPIVLIGNGPTGATGQAGVAGADARVTAAWNAIKALPTTRVVADEAGVPAALADLGLRPTFDAAGVADDVQVARRHVDGTDYYFIFNNGPAAVDAKASLPGAGQAYDLDGWTGRIQPTWTGRATDGRVVVDVDLDPQETMMVAVSDSDPWGIEPTGPAVVTSDADVRYGAGGLEITSTQPGEYDYALDNGFEGQATIGAVEPVQDLTTWDLTVQSWTPGPSGLPNDTLKTDLGVGAVSAGQDGLLPAWSTITSPVDLSDVSGVGTYRTTVQLAGDWSTEDGAILDLGRATDTTSVVVNGREADAVDPQARRVDISDLVRPGANEIEVVVGSTLRNAVRVHAQVPVNGAKQDYGLFGPVTLTPYGRAEVSFGAVTSDQAPRVTGTARAGEVLRAETGRWTPANAAVRVQWLRDGAPIAGATARAYRLRAADVGARVTVRVTASADGYDDTAATSSARTIRRGQAGVRLTVPASAKRAVVRFAPPAGVPVRGTVVVRIVGGPVLGRARVTTPVTRLALTRPKRVGRHRVVAVYRGSATVERKRSRPVVVTVR